MSKRISRRKKVEPRNLESRLTTDFRISEIEKSLEDNLQARINVVNAIRYDAKDTISKNDLFWLLNILNRKSVELEAQIELLKEA